MASSSNMIDDGTVGVYTGTGTINISGNIIVNKPDIVRVDKITYNRFEVLGKGCDGTFVYSGKFNNKDVAVKRLLSECFKIADREISLLTKSDDHPNVIRYFCTERDEQFIYIALELCDATVKDYFQGKYDVSLITPLEILKQATSGLKHLHSLDIVHRDIKPSNILLSRPNERGEVRAMISDFGLCRNLIKGKMSFSKSSGITGTEGWMAPEMLKENERMTRAVDLFSLGCLFYYVLSEGKHPFGESFKRQYNILSGEYTLSELKGDAFKIELSRMLISKLISVNADERPPAEAVLLHPLFWDNAKILGFFQDVSGRLENTTPDDPVIRALETNAASVVRDNWLEHIHEAVKDNLENLKGLKEESVRDLLRVIRTKKHHYWELSPEAQDSLGSIPDKFTSYWITRFPLLLPHTWLAMQCFKKNPIFQDYYPRDFKFDLPKK